MPYKIMPGHLQIVFDRLIIQKTVTVYRPIRQQLSQHLICTNNPDYIISWTQRNPDLAR